MKKIKSYKQFIKQAEEVFITNTHGKHAQKPDDKQYITNTHGKHAQPKDELHNPYYVKESINNSWEEFSKEDDNEHHLGKNTGKSGSDHYSQIKRLEDSHPIEHTSGLQAIKKYTSDSTYLNNHLLEHHKAGTDPTEGPRAEGYKQHMHDLDNHAFTPAKHKVHSYSGVNFDIRTVDPVGKSKAGNNVYHQPAYMSSSISKNVARSFAGIDKHRNDNFSRNIIHWVHDKGHPISAIGSKSNFDNEHEVLVPRTNSTKEKYHIEHLGTTVHKPENSDSLIKVHHVRRIPESEIVK